MHERVKEIRNYFKLSQAAFAEKIGLKQKAIGLVEQGVNRLTERNFEAICRVFNVNPVWLRTGEGAMFDTSVKSKLDVLCEEYGLSGEARKAMEMYLSFTPEQRELIAEYMIQTLEFYKKIQREAEQDKRREQLERVIADAQAELDTMSGGAGGGSDFAEESSDEAG